jgi:hypothetical protein
MIKEFKISDILNAVNSISEKKNIENKVSEKKDLSHEKHILGLNNQVKSNKSEVLVLDQMIE